MSGHKKPTASAELIESKFNSGLEKSKPYLFNLAQQVITAQPERNWSLLLGDDTSGRPVTHFIRQVLMRKGIRPPTAFFCAS